MVDGLSDQRIRREPIGLSCICLMDCESNHDVKSFNIRYFAKKFTQICEQFVKVHEQFMNAYLHITL